ncbi:MAG: radical SAM protein [Desulfobacterales bacterium]|nr:radical SAM protein [Desulfobacterales bacterium]MBF0396003.1 radical SAM protein [Desulfobacterales bacterium]
MEEIINELKIRKLLDGNPDLQITFTSDAFGSMPQDRILLQRVREELNGKCFKWLAQIDLASLNDESFLELINSVGDVKLIIGVESPFRDGLSLEKKGIMGINPIDIFEKIKKFSNIKIRLLLMLGFDFEPADAFEQMLSFIQHIQPDGVYISILTPFPGTKINEQLETQKRIFERDWMYYDTRHLVFERWFKRNENQYGVMKRDEFMAGFKLLIKESESEIKKWSRFNIESKVL